MENALGHAKNPAHCEGRIAKAIEEHTAKLPSDTFLWAAVGAVTAACTLQAVGKRDEAFIVSQFAPALLILGVYNKLVKIAGSE